jgi:hypothetical protein
MTTSPVVTTGEQVAETLHRLGYLIDRHSLPAPVEVRVRRLSIGVELGDLHDLRRWAETTDAMVTDDGWLAGKWHYIACSVFGDVPVRLTCYGKALTP